MNIYDLHLTPALAALLRGAHDDGGATLDIEVDRTDLQTGRVDVSVTRNNSDLTATEERKVTDLLAAYAVESL